MNKEILEALEAKMLAIAVRVGNENAGFVGDASSGMIGEDFVLWEGAGRVFQDRGYLICEWYGSPTERTAPEAHKGVAGVLEWIDRMDILTRD